jgi:arylsulfatase A-like enzyme
MVSGRAISAAAGWALTVAVWLWAAIAKAVDEPTPRPKQPAPNIIVIYADDLGYSDVGCFGDGASHTPHIDRLAREGIRFTQFYVAQPVCSASRAALLTGCYANRIGIHGALGPGARHGIHDDETTLAEIVKQQGYATAAVGKWHLGHHPQFLPTRHGFDEYFGLPYSNDMWPHHPEAKSGTYPPLPLVENDRTIDPEITPDDQPALTTRYTERAVRFIERNHDRRFLLYVAHSMPHVPLFVSDKFAGRSPRGVHGDVLMEIDWSVGEILAALERHKIDANTLVIFTSDNGPWLSYGNHAGSAGKLREGKGTVFEGGVRVPFVARWPARIPAGQTQSEPAMTIDLVPTVAGLIGARLPDHPIDGLDIWPLLAGQSGARNPHAAYFFYYNQGELQAVRSGRWKLMLPHTARTMAGQSPGKDGRPGRYKPLSVGLELYDLQSDESETTDVAARYPDVVGRLQVLADTARADLGDAQTKRRGSGTRAAGRLAD